MARSPVRRWPWAVWVALACGSFPINALSEGDVDPQGDGLTQEEGARGWPIPGAEDWSLSWPMQAGVDTLDGYRDVFTIGGRYADHRWKSGARDPQAEPHQGSDFFIGTVSDIHTHPSWGVVGRIGLLEATNPDLRIDASAGLQLSFDLWKLTWYKTPEGYLEKEGDARFDDIGYGLFIEGDYQPWVDVPVAVELRMYAGLNDIKASTDMYYVYAANETTDHWIKISIDPTQGTTWGIELGLRILRDIRIDFGHRATSADSTTRFRYSNLETGESEISFANESFRMDSSFTYASLSYSFF